MLGGHWGVFGEYGYVLLLQETHLTERRIADIHRMYAGNIKIFHSAHPHAPTQKEGVAIVLNKKLVSDEGAKMTVVVPGRAIQLTTMTRGEARHVLCIYAPTSEGAAERREFFEQVALFYELHPNIPKPHLMACDFNNVEDAIDRLPVAESMDSSVTTLDRLKMALGVMLVDGWRRTHPDERDYTFHRGTGDAATMARLDRIYVRPEVFDYARSWMITQPGVKSDHLLVSIQLSTPNEPEAGTGRPVFPLSLLKHKNLAKKMKARGLEAEAELSRVEAAGGRSEECNPQTILCKLKTDWMKMAREYERATIPKLLKEIKDLEDRLKEVKSDTHSSEQVRADDINALTRQIQQRKAGRLKQQQQRARAKHHVDGERPTKYWISMNRARAPRELIPAFEKISENGEVIYETNPKKMAEMARSHHDRMQADGPETAEPAQREQDLEDVLGSIEAQLTDQQVDMMAAKIEYNECELALRCAKTGTAPGIDGIQYEVWKTMHDRFKGDLRNPNKRAFDVLKVLTAAFTDIQTYGVCKSTSFAEGWMSPIWKEKGEKTKIVNYRPITLLNSDYKLMSKILAIRIAEPKRVLYQVDVLETTLNWRG
ncbi:Endonuclease/exonuclease/phosphatase [Cubamyces lactineus]|nr:Endonuclease/exonuclease/phosphatase [Cubamyces lactineus]